MCFRYASDMFQKCFRCVSDMSQICFRYVSDMFQTCFRYVSDMFQICFRSVPDMFQICVRHVRSNEFWLDSDRDQHLTSQPPSCYQDAEWFTHSTFSLRWGDRILQWRSQRGNSDKMPACLRVHRLDSHGEIEVSNGEANAWTPWPFRTTLRGKSTKGTAQHFHEIIKSGFFHWVDKRVLFDIIATACV